MKQNNNRIISASRRTDITALYLPWLKQRIWEKYCITVNPFNSSQVMKVSLAPVDVDCIVFWTRNPAPLLNDKEEFAEGKTFLEFLKENYNFYFLFTITGYPEELEPNLPPLEQTLENFCRLAEILSINKWNRRLAGSKEKFISPVVWRFDPIIISDITSFNYIYDKFSYVAQKLRRSCSRIITSIYDPYKKSERRLNNDGRHVLSIDELNDNPNYLKLLVDLKQISQENGMEIQSCCEDLEKSEILPGACIDAKFILDLFGVPLNRTKDPSQRNHCRCVRSRDIGAYNTCIHGCRYCYATRNFQKACSNHEAHYKEKIYEISPSLIVSR